MKHKVTYAPLAVEGLDNIGETLAKATLYYINEELAYLPRTPESQLRTGTLGKNVEQRIVRCGQVRIGYIIVKPTDDIVILSITTPAQDMKWMKGVQFSDN